MPTRPLSHSQQTKVRKGLCPLYWSVSICMTLQWQGQLFWNPQWHQMHSNARVSPGPDVFLAHVRDMAAHHRETRCLQKSLETWRRPWTGLFKHQAGFPKPKPTEYSLASVDTSNFDALSLEPQVAEFPGLAFLPTLWRRSTGERSEQVAHSGLPASKWLIGFQ